MNPEMNRDTAPRGLSWLIGPAIAVLGVALLLGGSPGRISTLPRAVPVTFEIHRTAAKVAPTASSTPRTKAIEEVRVGDRVLAGNPEGAAQEPEVDASSWVRIALTLHQPNDVVDVVLLRPRAWAEAAGAAPGATVPLDLAELGASGPALVTEVGPCPPIEGGAGPIVTGTFRHRSARVLDLALEGQSEAIGVTASHPFWSEDRGRFIKTGELAPGERLRTLEGETRVVSIMPREGEQPVYNIEVHSEHVYRVTSAGVLVHNAGCGKDIALGLDPYFKDLAQQTNSFHYKQWVTAGITRPQVSPYFGRQFTQAARNAKQIHFTLDGIDDVAGAVQLGKKGFNYINTTNFTNTELYLIRSNPEWFAKTIFYLKGQPIPFPVP